jgi:hypothetical protein
MNRNASSATVQKIMLDFADLTGLAADGKPPRRYLWTDAFAVCNFLELYRQTQDETWRDLASRLVDQVHHVLGRHRADAPHSGWISGLGDEEGELHPTRGGLRIGKQLNERRPDEPPDEHLEWDRDGQYYHYLTKWMHALHCLSRVTGDKVYIRWAMELAQAAHAGFSYTPSWDGAKRMYWKMSIDLSRPLVTSMGQHDPLDGLVTFCELQAAARAFGTSSLPDLSPETADLAAMCRGKEWVTADTLGIGGLLCDASRIVQLTIKGGFGDLNLLQDVVDAALLGLEDIAGGSFLELSGRYRLAFRELGLSIGLKGVERLSGLVEEHQAIFGPKTSSLRPCLEALREYLALAEKIERFWLVGTNQETGNWKEHREINMVMLATSLAPEEFLAAG